MLISPRIHSKTRSKLSSCLRRLSYWYVYADNYNHQVQPQHPTAPATAIFPPHLAPPTANNLHNSFVFADVITDWLAAVIG